MVQFLSLALSCCFFLNACSLPHVVVKQNLPKDRKIRVAVLPFRDAPSHAGSGEIAADAIITKLLSIPSYEIIERSALEQVLKEQNLSATGAVDSKAVGDLGKLLGADALVMGAVTEFQDRNKLIFPPARATVTARMVLTETGAIEWSGEYAVGWSPLKWITCIFWPLGAFWVVTSPSVENRVQKASRGIARVVSRKG